MIQILRHIIPAIITLALLFPYSNNFNYYKSGNNEENISLFHSPEFSEAEDGYTLLAKLNEGYTTEKGMPELPLFTTLYQLNPEKTYDFQFEILESYTIENIDVTTPAFDVTPAALIHGIITEKGVATYPYKESLENHRNAN